MKNLTLTTFLILLSFTFFGQPYVTTWQSDLVLNPYVPVDNTITILTDSLLTYDYTVDWGDGTQDTNITGNFTHAYSSAGTYTISITGVFPRLAVPSIDGNKLLSVDQWGGNQWTSMAEMFRSCPNLNILATDTPDLSACTSMDYMFQHCSNLDFDPGNWDVSNIETFLGTFFGCTLFDADLSSWQTSNATVMAAMFTNAENFNQDLNNWDVSNVEYTLLMFAGCSSLNQSFEGWDISSVQDMSDMFWDTAISIPNYDQTLLAWGDPSNTVQPNVHLDFPANYCLGDVARQNLINNFGWTINDYGQDCSVSGCIEETACNYDITAALDDGSCEFTIDACGVCGGTATVAGCTDSAACNFDPAADCDDASCDYSCGFISTWQTNANNESITIPTNGGGYDYSVDWGDGTITTGNTGDATHFYTNSGQHTIKITGDFPRIYFWLQSGAFKIHEINQWGTIQWQTLSYAFAGCYNLDVLATDAPDLSMVTEVDYAFYQTNIQTPDLSNWNVSNVTDMTYMFASCSNFTGNISSWDVSSLENAFGMFQGAIYFNGDLSAWDLSSVINLRAMFKNCSSFNADISGWDVSSVTDMNAMFDGASSFNQDLNNWDVSSVTEMGSMFDGAISFNQDLNNWDVSSVTDMNYMFSDASSFNQDLNNWNVSSLEGMSLMFYGASSFQGAIYNWDINSLTLGNNVFLNSGIIQENYDLILTHWSQLPAVPNGISLGQVPSFYCQGASGRDVLINTHGWSIIDFGNNCPGCTDPAACNYDSEAAVDDGSCTFVTDACGICGGTGTIAGCTDPAACNYDSSADCDDASCDYGCGFITTWQTTSDNESITIPTFGGGYAYSVDWGDGTITTGHTGNATHTYATSGTHTIKLAGDFPRIFFFLASSASKIYEINQWGNIEWQSFTLAFFNCSNLDVLATDAPDLSMVSKMNDAFTGTNIQSPDLSNWDVSSVTEMLKMFSNCTNFNGNISSWDVSSVEDAAYMFDGATNFNGDISAWDMSSAIKLRSMFNNATSFNADISGWDVSSVTDMNFMFKGATSFNQDLNNWDVTAVEDILGMFWGASSFQGAIYNWNISSLAFASNFLRDSGIIQENYDLILINWSQLPAVPNGINLDQVPSFYCPGASARAELINTHGWSVIDFGINCPGCTDPTACNYDSGAVIDDGSCLFIVDACGNCGGTSTAPGCTDEDALNYCGYADCDDGSCIYGEDICGECTIWDDVSGQCIADPNCQDSGTCLGDFNEDNLINAADLLTFLGVFGTTCAE